MHAGLEEVGAVFDFGVREGQLITKTDIQSQTRGDFVFVLSIEIQAVSAQSAGGISAALKEDGGGAAEEAGESVGEGSGREHEKAIGGDAVEHVDGVVSVAAAEFHFVATANPGDRTGKVDGVFVGVAGAGDGIAGGSVAADFQERRANGCLEEGV